MSRGAGGRAAIRGLPMEGNAFFRDAVPLLRGYVYFEGLPAVDHRSGQRLVEVWPRHGDVILEAPGHRPPDVVHHTERGVAIPVVIRNDANCEQVINLLETSLLPQDLPVQRVQTLHARFQLRRNSIFHELRPDGGLPLFDDSPVARTLLDDFFLQGEASLGLQLTEGKVLQLAADDAHSQAMRDGRVNVQRFA